MTPSQQARKPAWAIVLLAAALVVASCSTSDGDSDETEAGAVPTTNSDGAVTSSDGDSTPSTVVAEPTGDFLSAATFDGQATTVQGATFDLAGLANKDLVVWFWAPW